MSSKIDGIDARPAPVGAGQPVQRGRDATTGGAAQSDPREGVQITESAKRLAALEAAVRDMPEVDAARVAEVRRALAEGRHEVRPERIAEKLLRLEQLLARRDGK